MKELVDEKLDKNKKFRVQFFKSGESKFFYHQELYFYDRFTSRIDWAPYSIKPTSPEFETLAEAQSHAQENVVWPDTDKIL